MKTKILLLVDKNNDLLKTFLPSLIAFKEAQNLQLEVILKIKLDNELANFIQMLAFYIPWIKVIYENNGNKKDLSNLIFQEIIYSTDNPDVLMILNSCDLEASIIPKLSKTIVNGADFAVASQNGALPEIKNVTMNGSKSSSFKIYSLPYYAYRFSILKRACKKWDEISSGNSFLNWQQEIFVKVLPNLKVIEELPLSLNSTPHDSNLNCLFIQKCKLFNIKNENYKEPLKL